MRIKDIDNPETFQRLVHAIYVAEHGADFQVVDDRGGDFGNDGYIRSQRILLAVYCPEVRPTKDEQYRRKIRHDLDRAEGLVREHDYLVETWAFVTPGNLREPLQRFVRDQTRERGFSGICIGETHLTDLFLRHRHLHEQFRDLVAPQTFEQLSEIRRGVEGIQATLTGLSRGTEPTGPASTGSMPSPSVARAFELLSTSPAEGRRQLERIRLESAEARERMLAGYLIVQTADMVTEAERALAVIDATLPLADQQGDPTIRSVLRAQRAWLINQRFVDLDTHGYSYTRAESLVGLPLIHEELRGEIARELHRLMDEADALLQEAGSIAREHRAYPVLSKVLQIHASALVQRLILHQRVPALREQVEQDYARVRALYETSIRIESALGNVQGLAVAYHNYANDLRMVSSPGEARSLAQTALELEEANGLVGEAAKTRQLLRRLTGGLSENTVQLIVAASMGQRNFANRFKVQHRPDFIKMGWVQLRDADALRTLEEVRNEGLAEPESDDRVHGGLWRLTARGIDAAADFRRQGYGPPRPSPQDQGTGDPQEAGRYA